MAQRGHALQTIEFTAAEEAYYRDRDIERLVQEVQDVNETFKDLSVLLHDQQIHLQCIEQSIDRTDVHIEKGNDELRKTYNYASTCVIS
jgi:t-SNARE complex subunit (syntaxin)